MERPIYSPFNGVFFLNQITDMKVFICIIHYDNGMSLTGYINVWIIEATTLLSVLKL